MTRAKITEAHLPAQFFRAIEKLPALHELEIHRSSVDRRAFRDFLMHMQSLKLLRILSVRVDDNDLVGLKSMTQLHTLELAQTAARGEFLCLSTEGFSELRYLRVANSPFVAFDALGDFIHLEALDLEGTSLSSCDALFLASCREILALDVSGTRITDESVYGICQLRKLERVDVSFTKLSSAAFTYLVEHVPKGCAVFAAGLDLSDSQKLAIRRRCAPHDQNVDFYSHLRRFVPEVLDSNSPWR